MIDRLNQIYPVRYTAFFTALGLTTLSLLVFIASGHGGWVLVLFGALTAVGIYDLQQTRHAILRNYPIIGHLRFMLEAIRPELRQYFLESETEAAPFSRAQRTLVYARAKGQSDKRPFGTQLDVSAAGYEWITHGGDSIGHHRCVSTAHDRGELSLVGGPVVQGAVLIHPCTAAVRFAFVVNLRGQLLVCRAQQFHSQAG